MRKKYYSGKYHFQGILAQGFIVTCHQSIDSATDLKCHWENLSLGAIGNFQLSTDIVLVRVLNTKCSPRTGI